jgi:poly(A) polymerase
VAFVVGGSVRDFLLGRSLKDHDLATNADPDTLVSLFPDAVTVGKAFGVLKIPLRAGSAGHDEKLPEFLEIATFREDLEYRDHRHPTSVRFASEWEDAHRRDFTINAFFFDPATGKILDACGGFEDLKARKIRAIGDPSLRFKEDALRLLRAVRFAANLGFAIEEKTSESIRLRARLLSKVSVERIRDELSLILQGPHPARGLELLAEHELLGIALPELGRMKAREPEHWQATVRLLQKLSHLAPKRSLEIGFAALFHRLSRTAEAAELPVEEAAHRVEQVALGLRLSKDQAHRIQAVTEDLARFRDAFQMRDSRLVRWVAEAGFAELLELHRAQALAGDGNLAVYEFCLSRLRDLPRLQERLSGAKLLSGEDLIQLGLRPGPRFADILRTVEDLVIEGKLTTKEEALQHVLTQYVK